jgi:EAL domain-containing protein (putative c-di-GMP-specific phosphodiesterase class I)
MATIAMNLALLHDVAMNVHNSTQMSAQTHRQKLLAHDLGIALANRAIQVVYQPSFTLKDRHLIGAEALSRWTHPKFGPVPTDELIQVAEESGQIGLLGDCVLQTVLEDLPNLLAKWPTIKIAINISCLELSEMGFAQRKLKTIQSVSAQFQQHIEWELTESHPLKDLELAFQHLATLKAHGMTTAMDDFGAGQSSLVRLYQLPFGKIKLDRIFVLGLDKEICQQIIKSMITLAGNIQIQLIAEGIETQTELETLSNLGCRLGQGYFFCKPIALNELIKMTF